MVGWWIIAWFSWFDIAKRWTTKDSSLLKLCYFRWTILCYYYSTISNTKRWIGYFIKENIDMTTNWNIQSLLLLFYVSINNIKLGHASVSIIVFFFFSQNKGIFKKQYHILECLVFQIIFKTIASFASSVGQSERELSLAYFQHMFPLRTDLICSPFGIRSFNLLGIS